MKPASNESEKPQWWQRFSRALNYHRAPRPKYSGDAGFHFHHSELVIRNFPPTLGKTLQTGHK